MTPRPLLLATAVTAATLAAGAASAQSPSAYGCAGLETADPMAALEGKDGIFYRLNLDLRTNHPLSHPTAELVGRISDALAARGTTLIYVPVPTKSLAMPGTLPGGVGDFGFDIDLAEMRYHAFLDRLSEYGVQSVDTMAAMRGADGDPFLATDFHWSPAGAKSVAEAVAGVIRASDKYGAAEKTEFTTRQGESHLRHSQMRENIQAYCTGTVPQVEMPRFETKAESDVDASGGIFASESAGPPVALTGTSMSAEADFHFEGFLSDAAGLQVADYAITGGNQFGGITSYLLSEDYHDAAPAFVIWENPIYNNLGEFGETPLRELTAAAARNCEPVETRNPEPTVLEADISADRLPKSDFVRVDTGAPTGRRAVIHFVDSEGIDVSATITRPVRYDATRWFYQHAAPLWSEDLTTVRATLDQPARDGATLSICTTKETQS